jgi:hypothetical protein
MRYFKSILIAFLILLLSSCSTIVNETSNTHPDFKIGIKGFENKLKKEFEFEKLSIGTYFTTKNVLGKEKGLNLTFQKNDLQSVSNNLIGVYANKVKELVEKNLLHLDDYDYVNITFKNEQEQEGLTKSTSIKIRKKL